MRAVELRDVQELMDTLYGASDRERGIAQAVRKGTREQQLHELGDVLAWLASLANQLDLTLDDAMARYRDNPPL